MIDTWAGFGGLLGSSAGLLYSSVAFLLAPATASAQRVEDTFFNSVIPSRVDHLIGFTPTTFAIHPRGQQVVPITVRVGGRTYRYIFGNAAAAVGPSADIYLRNMIRGAALPEPAGHLRRPAAHGCRAPSREGARGPRPRRRRARRARGHPACASACPAQPRAGSPRAGSAPGRRPAFRPRRAATRSRCGARAAGSTGSSSRASAPQAMPRARRRRDGGLSEAASGNLAIAAVTSWSRARAFQRRHARFPSAERRRTTRPCARCRIPTPTRSHS